MDDPPLSRFIDCRNEGPFRLLILLTGITGDALVHLPQTGENATITERAHSGLARAFGGRFGIGHGKFFWAARVGARQPLVNLWLGAERRLRGDTRSYPSLFADEASRAEAFF